MLLEKKNSIVAMDNHTDLRHTITLQFKWILLSPSVFCQHITLHYIHLFPKKMSTIELYCSWLCLVSIFHCSQLQNKFSIQLFTAQKKKRKERKRSCLEKVNKWPTSKIRNIENIWFYISKCPIILSI